MTCIIIGDSIAVGVAQQSPECRSAARVGITTEQYVRRYTTLVHADSVLISLGSNDGNVNTESSLRLLRSRLTARNVVWLLSANNSKSREIVSRIAEEYGDRTIRVVDFVGRDRVHPTVAGYRSLANLWR